MSPFARAACWRARSPSTIRSRRWPIERESIALARRLGRRDSELTSLGNAAEDARRTGEWDSVEAKDIEAALQLDIEAASRLTLDRRPLSTSVCSRAGSEDAELANLVADLRRARRYRCRSRDATTSKPSPTSRSVTSVGALEHWMEIAQAQRPQSALPPAPGRDGGRARRRRLHGTGRALERLDAIGTRGRAVDADRQAIRAGIAAIEGDARGALAGYRAAIATWRALGLPWDEALTALSAVARSARMRPGSATGSRALAPSIGRLDAAPMVAILLETMAPVAHAAAVSSRRRPHAATLAATSPDPDPTSAA